jgi:molybdate transport system permease protein
MERDALWVTIKLASSTAMLLFLFGVPLSWWLSSTRSPLRSLVAAVVALPLVLPPTVLGFYLLAALGRDGVLGAPWGALTHSRLPFTFPGLLVGSVLFNLPFAVRPFVAAFDAVDRGLLEAAWCTGASRLQTFLRVVVPLAAPGLRAGVVLSFAHAVGEFGVAMMLGGNIPGVTRTLSIALYDDVIALDMTRAHETAAVLLGFSFVALWILGRQSFPASSRAAGWM